ncbi:hypothetical protein CDL15_Pgr008271 [Punica granatum]|uniref:Uncharacterized protein n=1 Tax=Punica granatum TaxID=22663 RepID=A0A218XWS2_PUNGR|nr:hypothetical protein CDL15_Pgr008271 [Punica granatum]
MWTRNPESNKCGRRVRKAINVDAKSVDAESKSSKCGRGVRKAINVDAESKSSKCGREVRKAINVRCVSGEAEAGIRARWCAEGAGRGKLSRPESSLLFVVSSR